MKMSDVDIDPFGEHGKADAQPDETINWVSSDEQVKSAQVDLEFDVSGHCGLN